MQPMFEQMIRCTLNNKIFVFSNDFATDGCTGCAFQDDRIGCENTPDTCQGVDGIWVQINLVVE